MSEPFTCNICYGLVLEDPVQTVCSHIFCGPCLAPCAGGPCPTCRAMLPPGKSGTPLRDCNPAVLRNLGRSAGSCKKKQCWVTSLY